MSIFGKGREQPLDPDVRGLVDAAMRVHQELGCAFEREVYAEALAMELNYADISTESNLVYPVIYNGRQLRHPCRADFQIPPQILVLVRAVNELNDRHALELVTLLKVARATQGVLLNFGSLKFDMRHAVAPSAP